MENKRYPNGYMPKIDYWQGRLLQAINANNAEDQHQAKESIAFFVSKQNLYYGTEYKAEDFFPKPMDIVAKRTIVKREKHMTMPCDAEVTFSFKGGGWNSAYGRTGESIMDVLTRRLDNLEMTIEDIDRESVQIETRESYDALLRATYMD